MAAALQCEICGGKLIGKPGGIFECDSCGTEYSTEWARAKIQEIKGTVKVEGTVKLDGPVEVKGGVNAESLLKRGWMALEDGKWLEALAAFDQVLNLEPENVRAHLGRYLGVNKIHTMTEAEEQYEKYFYVASREGETCPVCRDGKLTEKEEGLFRCPACGNLFDCRKKIAETRRIRQLADPELSQWFARLDARTADVIQKRDEEAWRRKEKEEEETRRRQEENKSRLAPLRKQQDKLNGKVISAGMWYTVGLKKDGTVVTAGTNYEGKCNVKGWHDIVAIAAGGSHTVGLKAGNTVVAVGFDKEGQCNVSSWQDIVDISAGMCHTVGLKSDGTVVAVGRSNDGQCDVTGWSSIVAIATGDNHTVGLKDDGTVVAVGQNKDGRCDVSGWNDIVAISAGTGHTVGLKSDGSVVAEGDNCNGQCNVRGWKDIIAISAGGSNTVGLKSDGTVVAAGDNSADQCNVGDWSKIVAIAVGIGHTVGLKSDGCVVAVGQNCDLRCNVSGWKLFCSIDTLEQEREEARRIAEEKRQARIASLNSEKATLTAELSNLKGLFSGRRRREIEARLAEIENELKTLK